MDITALFSVLLPITLPLSYRGVGDGGYSTKFYTGRVHRKVQSLALLYAIFGSDGSLSVYLSLTNVVPSTNLVSNFGSLLTAI